ncbi:flocculation protein FLO11-like [Rhagoletis pomonella]|uniref:flocculation protein FLO11-like n=1 Tax=Rhagoletis pomonella TaxID=28610 RepID=UPI001785FDDF|nr:flocculation protein FLO11-like [Rhagoletis pomonella]
MSNEFSEMVALSCPDLHSTSTSGGNATGGGGQVHVVDTQRRLSVKQMTATQLAAIRAAAAAEIKTVLAAAVANSSVSAPATPAIATPSGGLMTLNTGSSSSIDNATPLAVVTANKSVPATPELRVISKPGSTPNAAPITASLSASPRTPSPNPYDNNNHIRPARGARLLPLLPAARERITSLPNVLDDGMEGQFLSLGSDNATNVSNLRGSITRTNSPKPQLELHSVDNLSKGRRAVVDEDDSRKRSTSESSAEESETQQKHQKIADSVELLRMHRRQRDLAVARETEPERSLSPVSPGAPAVSADMLSRSHHERSAAPDRLHSSSLSSSGSALSASVNASKNPSRRGSAASTAEELSSTPATALPSLPIYPLAKTTSTPNMERRRSSLTALFPGPSPLVAPEPVLHTDPTLPKDDELTAEDVKKIVEDTLRREIPTGKMVHRTKTPPPVGVKLGVNLKKVSPPKSTIGIKKNDAPMLGVVLRRVEKKTVQQKSILDDDKPLYHFSIVRSDNKEHKPATAVPKPKPKPTVGLQKSATTAAVPPKPNPGGILTGPQGSGVRPAQPAVVQRPPQNQRPQMGVPITIQKIEGDKIIIIKKFIIPKNGKIPEQYLKVGWTLMSCSCSCSCWFSFMCWHFELYCSCSVCPRT